jgi:hypothetical protein
MKRKSTDATLATDGRDHRRVCRTWRRPLALGMSLKMRTMRKIRRRGRKVTLEVDR